MLKLKPETPTAAAGEESSRPYKAVGRSQLLSPLPSNAVRHTSHSLTKIAVSLSLMTIMGCLGISLIHPAAAIMCAVIGLLLVAVLLLVAHRRDAFPRSDRKDKSS